MFSSSEWWRYLDTDIRRGASPGAVLWGGDGSGMARLSRAEAQERNREKVLAAARAEFLDRGYRAAKIDSIAERAELTRGAGYSNFPGKRALYFAVLAADAMTDPPDAAPTATAPREALASFARAWVARLPLW